MNFVSFLDSNPRVKVTQSRSDTSESLCYSRWAFFHKGVEFTHCTLVTDSSTFKLQGYIVPVQYNFIGNSISVLTYPDHILS